MQLEQAGELVDQWVRAHPPLAQQDAAAARDPLVVELRALVPEVQFGTAVYLGDEVCIAGLGANALLVVSVAQTDGDPPVISVSRTALDRSRRK